LGGAFRNEAPVWCQNARRPSSAHSVGKTAFPPTWGVGDGERRDAEAPRHGEEPVTQIGFPDHLHALIAERYETTSTIVTSNLDLPEWDQAFPANRLLASATLGRSRHNAYCLVLDGVSYRAPKPLPGSAK